MADETIAAVNETPVEVRTAEPVGITKKTRASRKKAEPRPAKAATAPAAKTTRAAAKSASVAAEPATRTVKKYTPAQRTSILASVEKATKSGKTTLKAALQQLEVSEQTYYNWKNAAGKTAPAAAKAKTTAGGASDDLKALIALEAENLKLRKELAAKLTRRKRRTAQTSRTGLRLIAIVVSAKAPSEQVTSYTPVTCSHFSERNPDPLLSLLRSHPTRP
ncbi:hypothetical protein Q644_02670 [Brucella intermedia 229E]|uniref:Transposase n=1 Tax=Brucella intermedia 229E TaxID=1337887 RepID=U4VGN5_9HYPH|nr:hypothetical protein Q644_02670 [Brucella intermedia 229E]